MDHPDESMKALEGKISSDFLFYLDLAAVDEVLLLAYHLHLCLLNQYFCTFLGCKGRIISDSDWRRLTEESETRSACNDIFVSEYAAP